MKKLLATFALLLLLNFSFAQQSAPLFYEPSLSADGSEVAFVSGGDIWTVPSSGGEARLLVALQDTESRPLYSPDGKSMTFTSNITGNGDVYLFQFASGEVKRLTFDDAAEEVSAWSPDSRFIYFSSTGHDIAGMADVFRIPASGGTPMAVLEEPYTNEYFASPSRDGNLVAFNARGIGSRQWWRNGHSHIDESEIWTWNEKNNQLQKITDRGAKELWPMWSADGTALFYMSDRDGHENIWTKSLSGDAKQLTKFTDGRVLWPSISRDGNAIVFERNFQVWKYDIAGGKAAQVNIAKRGAQPTPGTEHKRLTNQFNNMVLSPDGKKIAFIAGGEVFAASVKDGGEAARLSNSPGAEDQPAWSPDSKQLAYVSDDDGASTLYLYTFATKTKKALTSGKDRDEAPVFSHDGKSLAYVRNGAEIYVLDIATGKSRLLTKGYLGRGPFSTSNSIAWSPDDKWIAYSSFGHKTFRNVFLVPSTGGEAKQISFLSNTFGGSLVWGGNGKYILFNTRQRTEDGRVARIDLVPKTPLFSDDKFNDLFIETIPSEKKVQAPAKAEKPVAKDTTTTKGNSTTIQFAGIGQRLTYLPIGMSVDEITISHDGKALLFIANVAGQSNLYSYSLDELSKDTPVAKQVTTTAGQKSDVQSLPDDKEVVYLERGMIFKANIESRTAKSIDVSAELDVDFNNQKASVFRQAWNIQNSFFYDSLFHGSNWNNVLKRFEPWARGAQTSDELRRVISQMLGELNASHSGVGAPSGTNVTSAARIGLKFDRAEYEKSGKLKVSSIVSLSPADVSGSVHVGDYITAVDDTLLTPNTNFDKLMLSKIGKRVRLSVGPNAKDPKVVSLLPVNQATEKRLLYRQWVNQQREYVRKASGGRLGYVHMYDMSAGALDQLYLDLDAENHSREGVVIDVRNNNGGFVNAYALDVLSRQGYMTMTVRGLPSAPARTQLGQRALELPTVLVTNQHSLSDAEDFTEGYRALHLGKVVGEKTAGWIIYTSSATLVDGSVMRLPFIRVTDHEGKNMELSPRAVDVSVTRALGESAMNKDTQLDAAVKTLLKQIDEMKVGKKY